MTYKLRIILDAEENVIRDIAILKSNTLEDLHFAITNAFGFTGSEMASFYLSDEEWSQGEEFPLMDMSENPGEVTQMREINILDLLTKTDDRLIYVYDFIFMWTFYVELVEISENTSTIDLPQLIFSLGEVPENAPEKTFSSEALPGFENEIDDEDEEDFDESFMDDFSI